MLSRKVLVIVVVCWLAKLGMLWPQALLEEENKELRQARHTVGMSRHHKVVRFSEVAISRNCLYPVVGACWI